MTATEAPAWFTDALASPTEVGEVFVRGATVRYRAWGPADVAGLILVHGGGAHGRWWDHIGPLLAVDRRVAAIDLTGHGDSDRREQYDIDTWVAELFGVAEAARLAGPPTIVGHSMGGLVALRTAILHGAHIAGAVVIDSPIRNYTPEEKAAMERRAFGPLRRYPSYAEAVKHFRTVPEEGPGLPYVAEHIARTSVREVDGGWAWKFDPRLFLRDPFDPDLPERLACRMALFRAEYGLLTEDMTDAIYDRLGRRVPVVEIPNAPHHVMIHEPLALVTGLRTLLADWDHTVPHP